VFFFFFFISAKYMIQNIGGASYKIETMQVGSMKQS